MRRQGKETISLKIKFAIFSDLHYEHIPDGFQRLENFVSKAKEAEVDFVIELGDFCSPKDENKVIIDMLEV